MMNKKKKKKKHSNKLTSADVPYLTPLQGCVPTSEEYRRLVFQFNQLREEAIEEKEFAKYWYKECKVAEKKLKDKQQQYEKMKKWYDEACESCRDYEYKSSQRLILCDQSRLRWKVVVIVLSLVTLGSYVKGVL